MGGTSPFIVASGSSYDFFALIKLVLLNIIIFQSYCSVFALDGRCFSLEQTVLEHRTKKEKKQKKKSKTSKFLFVKTPTSGDVCRLQVLCVVIGKVEMLLGKKRWKLYMFFFFQKVEFSDAVSVHSFFSVYRSGLLAEAQCSTISFWAGGVILVVDLFSIGEGYGKYEQSSAFRQIYAT